MKEDNFIISRNFSLIYSPFKRKFFCCGHKQTPFISSKNENKKTSWPKLLLDFHHFLFEFLSFPSTHTSSSSVEQTTSSHLFISALLMDFNYVATPLLCCCSIETKKCDEKREKFMRKALTHIYHFNLDRLRPFDCNNKLLIA